MNTIATKHLQVLLTWMSLLLPATAALAQVSVTPSTLDFGSIQAKTSKTMMVQVTNNGSKTVRLFFNVTGAQGTVNLVSGGVPRCGGSGSVLRPRSSCYQSLRWSPREAGSLSASLRVLATDRQTQTINVALRGTATAQARALMSVAPASLSLIATCGVRTPVSGNVTVSSAGNAPLRLDAVYLSGESSRSFKLVQNCGPLPRTLAAGASCVVTVSYEPRRVGTNRTELHIRGNAGEQRVKVTGSCAPPASP